MFAVIFIVLPQLLANSNAAMNAPVLGEILHLATPLGSLVSFWKGNAWDAQATLWGINLPSLLVAPVVQLSLAAWIVAAMARRLKNPLDPPLTKRRAYGTVLVIDLLLAAVCYALWREGASPGALVYGYCFGHVIASLLLVFAIVPRQTAVLSWIWRRRPHESKLRELALADRSEISLAALILGLIGPAALAVGFLAPMYFAGWPSADGLTGRIILEACVTTVIIVTALGITHQLLAAVPRRGGHLVYLLLLMALNIVPLITSAIQDADLFGAPRETIETVASLSPGAYYVMNMARWAPDVACGWLVALYACLAALSYWLLQSWLRRQTAVIDRKLQSLDLRPTAHSA